LTCMYRHKGDIYLELEDSQTAHHDEIAVDVDVADCGGQRDEENLAEFAGAMLSQCLKNNGRAIY
jgi:hypothetical protein